MHASPTKSTVLSLQQNVPPHRALISEIMRLVMECTETQNLDHGIIYDSCTSASFTFSTSSYRFSLSWTALLNKGKRFSKQIKSSDEAGLSIKSRSLPTKRLFLQAKSLLWALYYLKRALWGCSCSCRLIKCRQSKVVSRQIMDDNKNTKSGLLRADNKLQEWNYYCVQNNNAITIDYYFGENRRSSPTESFTKKRF